MRHIPRILLFLMLLFIPHTAYSKPAANMAIPIGASVFVGVVNVGSGSGVVIATGNGRSFILSNDHVCQMTRGENFSERPAKGQINAHQIIIEDINRHIYYGRVEVTANRMTSSTPLFDDLCLISISGVLPFANLASTNAEIGEEVFSISNPMGLRHVIHAGYVGGSIDNRTVLISIAIAHGSSGGGVFSKETGELIALIYAGLQDPDFGVMTTSDCITRDQIYDFLHVYLDTIMNKYKKG